MDVTLNGLVKHYRDGTEAVRSIDLDIAKGEFITLLGPSGCGKTTTLRLIAGLEEATEGSIVIGGRDVTLVDPGDRNVAMVFQTYALYPHMTALQNMTLGLTVAGMPKAEAAEKARQTATLLGIEHLLSRKPSKLSGGERQRVALGRAMVRNPACFLMDEPLSNLDLKRREHMRTELKRLHQQFPVTTIYVTHDQAEALILSDRVAVMNEGNIQQVADPVTIYERPANTFVADFIGSPSINFLNGALRNGTVTVAGRALDGAHAPGSGPITLGVRPEDVILTAPGNGVIEGTIDFTEPYGGVVVAFIAPMETHGLIKNREHIDASIDVHQPIEVGARVGISFRAQRINLFDASTGGALPGA
ncbi:MAG: ABC transporter ATP-binding protein [Gammaproteobacteria bacterium]